MTMGKGGKNIYWYTEGDARRACEEALSKVTFLVTVTAKSSVSIHRRKASRSRTVDFRR